MVRPLRIEFAGATYHITSRGDRQEAIVENDEDRREFVALLGDVTEQMGVALLRMVSDGQSLSSGIGNSRCQSCPWHAAVEWRVHAIK